MYSSILTIAEVSNDDVFFLEVHVPNIERFISSIYIRREERRKESNDFNELISLSNCTSTFVWFISIWVVTEHWPSELQIFQNLYLCVFLLICLSKQLLVSFPSILCVLVSFFFAIWSLKWNCVVSIWWCFQNTANSMNRLFMFMALFFAPQDFWLFLSFFFSCFAFCSFALLIEPQR